MENFNHDQFIRNQVGAAARQPGADQAIRQLANAYANRDRAVIDSLRGEARRRGLGQDQVDRLLVTAGLLVDQPLVDPAGLRVQAQGTVAAPQDGDLAATVARLADTVDRLVRAAGDRGIHV